MKGLVPANLALRLDHLSVDLGAPKCRLIVEALLLLLRYHGRGEGLGLPMDPVQSGSTETSARDSKEE